jgi:hypothetical protein
VVPKPVVFEVDYNVVAEMFRYRVGESSRIRFIVDEAL